MVPKSRVEIRYNHLMKYCRNCAQHKDISEFIKSNLSKDGVSSRCAKCQEDFKMKSKQYRIDNHASIKLFKTLHKRKNQKFYNKKAVDARKNDPIQRLQKVIRSSGVRIFKGQVKSGSTTKYLGCSLEYLKVYLESKFKDGMTWDNHGLYGWHLDHIKPVSSFNLSVESELRVLCHYTNLQPLWAKDNLSKGDTI